MNPKILTILKIAWKSPKNINIRHIHPIQSIEFNRGSFGLFTDRLDLRAWILRPASWTFQGRNGSGSRWKREDVGWFLNPPGGSYPNPTMTEKWTTSLAAWKFFFHPQKKFSSWCFLLVWKMGERYNFIDTSSSDGQPEREWWGFHYWLSQEAKTLANFLWLHLFGWKKSKVRTFISWSEMAE